MRTVVVTFKEPGLCYFPLYDQQYRYLYGACGHRIQGMFYGPLQLTHAVGEQSTPRQRSDSAAGALVPQPAFLQSTLDERSTMAGNSASAMQQVVNEDTSGLMRQLADLLAESQQSPQQERSSPRFPLNCAMRLIPLRGKGKLLHFEPTEIIGKDLSPTGIGFSHKSAIPHNRVIIYFFHPNITRFAVEAIIVWTRSKSSDEYESGCRLIRKLAPDEMVAMF